MCVHLCVYGSDCLCLYVSFYVCLSVCQSLSVSVCEFKTGYGGVSGGGNHIGLVEMRSDGGEERRGLARETQVIKTNKGKDELNGSILKMEGEEGPINAVGYHGSDPGRAFK